MPLPHEIHQDTKPSLCSSFLGSRALTFLPESLWTTGTGVSWLRRDQSTAGGSNEAGSFPERAPDRSRPPPLDGDAFCCDSSQLYTW